MTVVELGLYALLLAVAAIAVWRRPVVALFIFVVGLALHNAVMAALYAAGVRGTTLTAITAWKEILLAVALCRVGFDAWRARKLPFRFGVADSLAVAFGALVVVYALIPQSALDGLAGHKAVALALRHDLVPVGAYFLGRSLLLRRDDLRRLGWTLLGTAAVVAGWGSSTSTRSRSGGGGRTASSTTSTATSATTTTAPACAPSPTAPCTACPRTSSTTSATTSRSCAGSSRRFSVLLRAATSSSSRCCSGSALRRAVVASRVLAAAGLLWTFSRSSLVAVAVGLLVLAAIRRRPWGVVAAAAVIGVAIGWAHLFPKIGPTGTFTKVDITYQQAIGKNGPKNFSAASENEPSLHSHWLALKEGVQTMIHHPQGYGLGNVGQTASRTATPLKAGESNYTELGVELGVLGALLWIAWGLAVLIGLVRGGDARMAAAFAAILALAVQTDVIGDPWVAYCVWVFAGAFLTRPQERLAASPVAALALP